MPPAPVVTPAEPAAPAEPGTPAAPVAPAFFQCSPRDGTWTLAGLFEEIERTTPISIVYDTDDASFRNAQIFICGVHRVAMDDLFDWLQAVVSYRKLIVTPTAERNAAGKQQWLVTRGPRVGCPPLFIDANEVAKYADREGLFIVTSIALSPATDATQMRDALSSLLTVTDSTGEIAAGNGRIGVSPREHALIVGDFAPVVAEVVRRAAVLEKEFAGKAACPAATGPR